MSRRAHFERIDGPNPDGSPRRWQERTPWTLFDLATAVNLNGGPAAVERYLDSTTSAVPLGDLEVMRRINELCVLKHLEPLFQIDSHGHVAVDPEVRDLLEELRQASFKA